MGCRTQRNKKNCIKRPQCEPGFSLWGFVLFLHTVHKYTSFSRLKSEFRIKLLDKSYEHVFKALHYHVDSPILFSEVAGIMNFWQHINTTSYYYQSSKTLCNFRNFLYVLCRRPHASNENDALPYDDSFHSNYSLHNHSDKGY